MCLCVTKRKNGNVGGETEVFSPIRVVYFVVLYFIMMERFMIY